MEERFGRSSVLKVSTEGPLVHSRLIRDSGSKVASEQPPATRTNVPDLLEQLTVALCVLPLMEDGGRGAGSSGRSC